MTPLLDFVAESSFLPCAALVRILPEGKGIISGGNYLGISALFADGLNANATAMIFCELVIEVRIRPVKVRFQGNAAAQILHRRGRMHVRQIAPL